MEIYINRQPGTIINEIYLVSNSKSLNRGNVLEFFNFKENGESIITQKVLGEGGQINSKPTFLLSEMETKDLIQAFSILARQKGLESKSSAQGKLEATQDHLKDLRQLLKLK